MISPEASKSVPEAQTRSGPPRPSRRPRRRAAVKILWMRRRAPGRRPVPEAFHPPSRKALQWKWIQRRAEVLTDVDEESPVTLAANEIAEGKVKVC